MRGPEMRHLKYLPLAFLAGVHGFAILAPYLAFCVTAHAVMLQRKRRLALVPVSGSGPIASPDAILP